MYRSNYLESLTSTYSSLLWNFPLFRSLARTTFFPIITIFTIFSDFSITRTFSHFRYAKFSRSSFGILEFTSCSILHVIASCSKNSWDVIYDISFVFKLKRSCTWRLLCLRILYLLENQTIIRYLFLYNRCNFYALLNVNFYSFFIRLSSTTQFFRDLPECKCMVLYISRLPEVICRLLQNIAKSLIRSDRIV